MMPRAFVAVPTYQLTVDPSTSSQPGKYPAAEMRKWMARVPEIYELQCKGMPDAEFFRMSTQPQNEKERELGMVYQQLFSSSASAHPIRASFAEDVGLIVDAGQHRTLAAKDAGVPFVPVHVSAPDSAQLRALAAAFEADVQRLRPDLASVPEIHRRHDFRHKDVRSQVPQDRLVERDLGFRSERHLPERER